MHKCIYVDPFIINILQVYAFHFYRFRHNECGCIQPLSDRERCNEERLRKAIQCGTLCTCQLKYVLANAYNIVCITVGRTVCSFFSPNRVTIVRTIRVIYVVNFEPCFFIIFVTFDLKFSPII